MGGLLQNNSLKNQSAPGGSTNPDSRSPWTPEQCPTELHAIGRDETAINRRDWREAESLLKLGVLIRPPRSNARLRAVQHNNWVVRRLLLAITYRDVG